MTVPLYVQALTNLLRLMEKAEQYAKEKKFDPAVLLTARLAPDMYTFTQQVQYAYFLPLDVLGKLSGKKEPMFDYQETSFKELKESVKKTLVYIKTIKPQHLEGSETKSVAVFYDAKQKMSGAKYVERIGIPDFFFHYTIAYAILRHNGVSIGKADFIGKLKQ